MLAFLKKYKLYLLFLIAFLIRLIHLNQSLWLDEATTAMAVKTYGFFEIMSKFSPADFHPPLYYLLMDLWTNIFGYSEVSLRMPSVLFSLLTGFYMYKIGQEFLNKTFGFWTAAFFLFNPLIIYYSQEARMYMMVTFLISVNFYYLLKLKKNTRIQSNIIFHLTLASMFLTFYASVFYITAVFFYLLFIKNYRLLFASLISWVFGLIVISPLLYTQYIGSKIALQSVQNWSLVLGNVSLKNLLLIPLKFTSGRLSFGPKIVYYALAGGWLAVCLGVLLNVLKSKGKVGFMFLFFLIFPLIVGIIFSFISPLLQYFRFQYLIVFLSLILALYTYQKFLKWVLIIGFVSWSLLYLLNPQFHREDWKSLSEKLKSNGSPVHIILSSADPLRYYSPEIQMKSLRTIEIQKSQKVTVVSYTADIHGVDYKNFLQKNNFKLESSFSVRNLQYEVWSSSL